MPASMRWPATGARGQPALAIAWGIWENTGLVKGDAGERTVAELARQGIRAFAPAQGTALFPWLCGGGSNVVVLPVDWDMFRRARGGRDLPLYREVFAAAGGTDALESGLAARLAAAPPAQRRALLETVVKDTVGQVLKIAPARLDSRKTLGAMGMNSLLAMELRNRLEAVLGRPLSATLAWNYPTVEALAAHLADGAATASAPAPVEAPDTPVVQDVAGRLEAVADLSDADAALALRAARARTRR